MLEPTRNTKTTNIEEFQQLSLRLAGPKIYVFFESISRKKIIQNQLEQNFLFNTFFVARNSHYALRAFRLYRKMFLILFMKFCCEIEKKYCRRMEKFLLYIFCCSIELRVL
jgi:hypothetical protein